jgi:hypothetical protein
MKRHGLALSRGLMRVKTCGVDCWWETNRGFQILSPIILPHLENKQSSNQSLSLSLLSVVEKLLYCHIQVKVIENGSSKSESHPVK